MGERLLFSESKTYAERHAHKGLRAFSIDVPPVSHDRPEIHFGALYLTPATYTIAWPGAVDFSKLEPTALDCLALALSNGRVYRPAELRSEAHPTASFILRDGLLEFDLTQSDKLQQYSLHLEQAEQILFARYDVRDVWSPATPEYAFTADNPQTSPPGGPELTVLLPRSQSPSPPLLDWLVDHHTSRDSLRRVLDVDQLLEEFPLTPP